MRKNPLIKPPDLCEKDLEISDGAELLLEPETEWRAQQFSGVARGDARNGRFSGVLWKDARLSAVSLAGSHLEDTIFRDCDLANLDARRVFASRVEVLECRALGFCAPESNWRDAVFRACNFSLCQFRHAKFERARFENCDFREADFQNADLRGVIFQDCDLRGAQFSFAKLQNADICSSQTEDLAIDASALRGLIVSPLQAAQLAAILGLEVRWHDTKNQ